MNQPYPLLLALCGLFFYFQTSLVAQISNDKDIATAQAMLFRQQADWNKGDIESFMDGYWQSDKLKFIGATGVTYGYDATLKGYHKRYPDRTAMGRINLSSGQYGKTKSESYHAGRKVGFRAHDWRYWWRFYFVV